MGKNKNASISDSAWIILIIVMACFSCTPKDSENTSPTTSTLTSPAILSATGPANGSFNTGQSLTFNLTFSEPVVVSGAPSLAITLGSTTVYANYSSGSGTTVLTFGYTIQVGDSAANGIAITSPIILNGGTIQGLKSQPSNVHVRRSKCQRNNGTWVRPELCPCPSPTAVHNESLLCGEI